ncbi:MAG: hypothetical protein HY026_03240 [Deltaproteobacteria bacterium]|nr:hypothetical protein [Deltaproteobacteria bacterium]
MWNEIYLSQDSNERAATKPLETCLAEQNTKALGSGKEALQNLFCPEKFQYEPLPSADLLASFQAEILDAYNLFNSFVLDKFIL